MEEERRERESEREGGRGEDICVCYLSNTKTEANNTRVGKINTIRGRKKERENETNKQTNKQRWN